MKDLVGVAVLKGLVRFAVTPPLGGGARAEPFAAQLTLARVHSRLVALIRVPHGYGVELGATKGWFELPVSRGLAGYGLARALRILLDVLAGLTALHDTHTDGGAPFVHGEVCPALIRVDDLGMARLIPLAPWHWSAPGTVAAQGRWGHLAPERLLGDALEQRADVFSAGVLLWEALAGRRLFENQPIGSIVTRLMGGKIILPPLPPELTWAAPLKSIAMCALAVDPEQRFANCAELAEAIEAVAGDKVATHTEVAAYFNAPDRPQRPSVIERPALPPTHNSSLSALVSPVQASVLRPTQPSAGEHSAAFSDEPESHGSRKLWAAVAILSVLSAIGLSFVTLRNAARQGERAAAARGPSAGLVSTPTRTPTLPTRDALAAPPLSAAPELPLPVDSAAPPGSARLDAKELLRKHSGKGVKAPGTGLKLRAPAKASPGRNKEADYGI